MAGLLVLALAVVLIVEEHPLWALLFLLIAVSLAP